MAAERSYSPYSRFRVGAVVVAADGATYEGTNVENGAYGSAMCAEAVAVATAVAAGARKIDRVVIACIDAPDIDGSYPCGNCLQLMNEFGVEEVVVSGAGEGSRRHDFEELLPHGFTLAG